MCDIFWFTFSFVTYRTVISMTDFRRAVTEMHYTGIDLNRIKI